MSDSKSAFGSFPRHWDEPEDNEAEVQALRIRIAHLEVELAGARKREEGAYLHGLGAAKEVYRQNQLLSELVAGLVDPYRFKVKP